MIWYVSRRSDGAIASAHEEPVSGAAEEAVDDAVPELAAFLDAARNPLPVNITPLQLRRALNTMGIRPQVESYVAQASQDVKDAWDYASTIEITDPLLVTAAQLLRVDLPGLFRLAATFPRYQ